MLKPLLFAHCQNYIKAKKLLLEKQKNALQLALTSESKSSAGDKHETGRAMIQLEREKLGNQIAEVEQNQQRLNAIKNHKSTKSVTIGSIVLTDQANYFIAIAADLFELEEKKLFINGKVRGLIQSYARSEWLKKTIGIAHIDTKYATDGQRFLVVQDDEDSKSPIYATVCSRRFYNQFYKKLLT